MKKQQAKGRICRGNDIWMANKHKEQVITSGLFILNNFLTPLISKLNLLFINPTQKLIFKEFDRK